MTTLLLKKWKKERRVQSKIFKKISLLVNKMFYHTTIQKQGFIFKHFKIKLFITKNIIYNENKKQFKL